MPQIIICLTTGIRSSASTATTVTLMCSRRSPQSWRTGLSLLFVELRLQIQHQQLDVPNFETKNMNIKNKSFAFIFVPGQESLRKASLTRMIFWNVGADVSYSRVDSGIFQFARNIVKLPLISPLPLKSTKLKPSQRWVRRLLLLLLLSLEVLISQW